MVADASQPRDPDAAGGYSLEPAPTAPALPGSVVMRSDRDDAIDSLLEDLVPHALACVREFGDFHLAAPGDREFESLYVRLMIDPRFRALPWKRTHLWLLHEHTSGDGRSMYRQIDESVVAHSDIPPEQAHAVDLRAADPAADYEKRIRAALEWREPGHDRLDAVVLAPMQRGLGAGPTDERLVYSLACPDTGAPIVALTPSFLRSARLMSVLATGAPNCAHVRAIADAHDETAWPLAPVAGELRWYVDAEAAGA